MWEVQPEPSSSTSEAMMMGMVGKVEPQQPGFLFPHSTSNGSSKNSSSGSNSNSNNSNSLNQVPSTPPRGAWEDTSSSPLLYSLSSPFSSPGLPTQVRLAAMREERANLLLHQKQQQTEHLQRQLAERDESIRVLECKVKDLAAKARLHKERQGEVDELRFRLKSKMMAAGGSTAQLGLVREQLGRAKSMLERRWRKERMPAKELAAWRAVTTASIESRERIVSSWEASRRRTTSSAAFGALQCSSMTRLEIRAQGRGLADFLRSHAVTMLLTILHSWLASSNSSRTLPRRASKAWISAVFSSMLPNGMRLTAAGMLVAALAAAAYKVRKAAEQGEMTDRGRGAGAGLLPLDNGAHASAHAVTPEK
jgi:hypothetical protein